MIIEAIDIRRTQNDRPCLRERSERVQSEVLERTNALYHVVIMLIYPLWWLLWNSRESIEQNVYALLACRDDGHYCSIRLRVR